MKMLLCVPCLFGLEGLVGNELRHMGLEDVAPENFFDANEYDLDSACEYVGFMESLGQGLLERGEDMPRLLWTVGRFGERCHRLAEEQEEADSDRRCSRLLRDCWCSGIRPYADTKSPAFASGKTQRRLRALLNELDEQLDRTENPAPLYRWAEERYRCICEAAIGDASKAVEHYLRSLAFDPHKDGRVTADKALLAGVFDALGADGFKRFAACLPDPAPPFGSASFLFPDRIAVETLLGNTGERCRLEGLYNKWYYTQR